MGIERTRAQLIRIVGSGEEVTTGQIPFTPRTKKVLELALREALSLGHNYIGTEHILLALIRENEGVAARILLDFLDEGWEKKVRNEVIRMLSGPGARRRPPDPLPEELTYEMVRAGIGRLPVRHRTQKQFRGILKGFNWDRDRCTVSYVQPITNGIEAEWSAQRRDLCECSPAEVRGWEVMPTEE